MTHEKSSAPNARIALLIGTFSPEEAERLCSIRTRLYEKPDILDRVLDEQRRRFARYLREQGEITDEVE